MQCSRVPSGSGPRRSSAALAPRAKQPSRGRITEVAVEKGAANILMPISSCRQLNDLPDDLAAKITIHYYLDAKDALLKALAA